MIEQKDIRVISARLKQNISDSVEVSIQDDAVADFSGFRPSFKIRAVLKFGTVYSGVFPISSPEWRGVVAENIERAFRQQFARVKWAIDANCSYCGKLLGQSAVTAPALHFCDDYCTEAFIQSGSHLKGKRGTDSGTRVAGYGNDWTPEPVTHWQPLPEPPEE